jgi:SAM-dependent methyltransferase
MTRQSFTPAQLRAMVKGRCEWNTAVETAARLARTVQARLPHDARKFLDLDAWLDINLKRAGELGLLDSAPQRILDLGSGTGQFLFVCETLGHQAMGVDLPYAVQTHPEREIFEEMPPAFVVSVRREAIQSMTPLTVDGTFDLITSFMVCFNNHKLESEWGRAEWSFFVDDMVSRLNPGGRLALRLNHNEEKFGPHGYLDRETTAFFASLGTIEDGKILIRKP